MSPGAGRPRRADVDQAIARATLELLSESGFERLTIEAVAQRAGTGRPTVYRRFPSKAALVAGAVAGSLATANPTAPRSDDVNTDVRSLLTNLVAALDDTPLGTAVTELIGPAARDTNVADTLQAAIAERRELIRGLLERTGEEGRLRCADVEAGIDMLLGAIYFRHLITRQAMSPRFVGQIVDTVVQPRA